tara:strand:- start:54 stop:335 length:282 start_codon:yes stop_codon:yes gene_type:complete
LSRPKLIKKLQQKNPKLNISEIVKIVDCFSDSIQYALINGRKVELRGFGSFFIKKIKEKYSARNPKTGELIYVPEKNKVRFKASKNLKKIINE